MKDLSLSTKIGIKDYAAKFQATKQSTKNTHSVQLLSRKIQAVSSEPWQPWALRKERFVS